LVGPVHGDYNMTGSIVTINQRTDTSPSEKFLRLGHGLLVRKFDDSLLPVSTSREIWLGFRWRLQTAYHWQNTSSNALYAESNRLAFGVCDTNGLVFGQTGSLPTSSVNTGIKFMAGIQVAFNSATWSLDHTSSNNITYGVARVPTSTFCIVTGSSAATTNTISNTFFMPATQKGDRNRGMFILRLVSGSGFNWNMATAYPSRSLSGSPNGHVIDYSSSVHLADIFNQVSWASASKVFPSYGMGTSSLVGTAHIDKVRNGYPNGIFFAWPRYFDTLEISDVVVKFIT